MGSKISCLKTLSKVLIIKFHLLSILYQLFYIDKYILRKVRPWNYSETLYLFPLAFQKLCLQCENKKKLKSKTSFLPLITFHFLVKMGDFWNRVIVRLTSYLHSAKCYPSIENLSWECIISIFCLNILSKKNPDPKYVKY